jgi:hypothetical protein
MMRTKVFNWLLLSDFLNTRLAEKKNWKVAEEAQYVLCVTGAYEDIISSILFL